jgi:putative tryptophan/tyrosine transport system substrate-binding protein
VTSRRAFIDSFAGGLLVAPFITLAQQPAKVPRIGVFGGSRDGPAWDGLRQGLRELGYTEGRNISVEWRWSEGKTERFSDFALELVQMKVDLIVTAGVQATRAAKQATSSTPIVMLSAAYPDKVGLVDSLARPGGNVTGLTNNAPELMGKRLQLLKEVGSKVSRVAVMWNPSNPVEPISFRELLASAGVVGLEIQSIEVRAPGDHPAAFATMTANRPDALLVFVNPVNSTNRQLIADFAFRYRFPSISDERAFADAGMLLSYGPSFIEASRHAATYIDRILKGAKPADLPIQQPTRFELVINLKTAKAFGLTIPRSLLLGADDVIQ